MNNLEFLKKILMSEDEYWIVARRNDVYSLGRREGTKDSIVLTCIPPKIRRGLKLDEIMLSDLEQLQRADLDNIYINEQYAPFQHGFNLWNVYEGFPIKTPVKEFMMDAILLGSNSIYDYKALANQIPEPELS